jgi:hypothetical protein
MSFRQFTTTGALVLGVLVSTASHAALRVPVREAGGKVMMTLHRSDASHDQANPIDNGAELFANHGDAAGTHATTGTFEAGTEPDFVANRMTPGERHRSNAAHPGGKDAPGAAHFDVEEHQVALASVTPAVPEPQTYALLLAGFGAMGLVARRRRR